MKDFRKTYKYSCRNCPIRQRCIDEKKLAPGFKLTIARRFENNTDTLDTWDILQQDCLLVREEQQRAAYQANPTTGLLNRLHRTSKPARPAPAPLSEPASSPAPAQKTGPCGLVVLSNQRIMRLPNRGEVVLGRFEHNFSNPPDIDLTFDDGEFPSVSRRHALIIGHNGHHWIEDMGSTNGTYLNGRKIPVSENVKLAPGHRLLLGRCRLLYALLPNWAIKPDPGVSHTCFFLISHTGQRVEIPAQENIMLGRADPTLSYAPDIDLSLAGEAAAYVSRRHAQLKTRNGRHFIQEAGSAGGTRINGQPIRLGDAPALLYHGDQVWLGGCVIAYEWKLL
jgi:pSer/pThr/pTyr-binding forkhead associated (FHA) protein